MPNVEPIQVGRERHDADEMVFRATDSGVSLSVALRMMSGNLVVQKAQHSGACDALERDVLDSLCSVITGRPLREAADHGAIYVMKLLSATARTVQGIQMPRNSGPAFSLAERLIRGVDREARRQLQIKQDANWWHQRPSSKWLQMSDAEQIEALKPTLDTFLRAVGLAENALSISHVERGIRVTIGFGMEMDGTAKARLLMQLEGHIRATSGIPLEIFMEERQDANKIRRLQGKAAS